MPGDGIELDRQRVGDQPPGARPRTRLRASGGRSAARIDHRSGVPGAHRRDPPAEGDPLRSRRRFRIRIRKHAGVDLVAVAVYVNGKPVKVVKGRRLTAPVDLRGLPRGTVSVRIEAAMRDGRRMTHTRKYRTCVKYRGAKRRHHL